VPDDEPALVKRMIELATEYGRYGYRRITAMLRADGWHVNHKRIERLWWREGLKVPSKQPKRKRLWLNDGSCVRLRPAHKDHVWAYDFVHDRTHDGRPLRMLTLVDEYTRECLAIDVGRRMTSEDVLERLTDLFIHRGVPDHIRSDNGAEFTANAVRAARRYGVSIWAWWNWNEFQNVRRDWLKMIDPQWYERPRKYWCTRDGSRFYHGIPDWGDEDVRQRLVGLARESLGYGVDGLYLSTRTHSWYMCWPTPDWKKGLEPFGFNDSVVDAYRKRHGVDIRYDKYDEDNWHRIKGELYSGFLSRVGAAVHQHDKPFILGVWPDRHNMMCLDPKTRSYITKNIQLYKDWETWVASGSIDGLCAEQTCPHEPKLTGGDISLFKKTLPGRFPLYTWADTATWIKRESVPFSLNNWSRHPVQDVLKQIDMARDTGASGIVLHSLYHYTACDTAGKFIGKEGEGYGVLPRTEYLDALRAVQKAGRWAKVRG